MKWGVNFYTGIQPITPYMSTYADFAGTRFNNTVFPSRLYFFSIVSSFGSKNKILYCTVGYINPFFYLSN